MKISCDISKVIKVFGKIKSNSDDARPLFKAVSLYHLRQVDVTFRNEGKRDEHSKWKPFAPQYTRKDGTVIPAWGGVKKLRGKGLVKGRLRPSGQRITKSSKLLRDTGTMENSFRVILLSPKMIIYGSQLPYAPKHQFGEDNTPQREMLFFTDADTETVQTLLTNWTVDGILKT